MGLQAYWYNDPIQTPIFASNPSLVWTHFPSQNNYSLTLLLPPRPYAQSGPILGYCNGKLVARRQVTHTCFVCVRERVSIPVTPFIVIPRHELHEGFAKTYSSLGIKYAWPTTPLYEELWIIDRVIYHYRQKTYKLQEKTVKQYLVSPTKSLETTSSSVYPRMPFSGPSEAYLKI